MWSSLSKLISRLRTAELGRFRERGGGLIGSEEGAETAVRGRAKSAVLDIKALGIFPGCTSPSHGETDVPLMVRRKEVVQAWVGGAGRCISFLWPPRS